MNHTFSEYIIQFLVDQGVVNWASIAGPWPAVAGVMPDNDDNPNNFVSVLDTAPTTDGVDHRGKKTIQHPTFQIFIRSDEYPVAYKKGKEIEAYLQTIDWETVVVDLDTAVIQGCIIKIPTAFMKQQEKNQRQVFVLNIQTTMWEVG